MKLNILKFISFIKKEKKKNPRKERAEGVNPNGMHQSATRTVQSLLSW